MELIKVTKIDDIKAGDQLVITGDNLINKSVTALSTKK